MQKLHGVEDSPEKYFRDMTDWSVVTKNGLPEYRYNNFALMRASANVQPKVFDYPRPMASASGRRVGCWPTGRRLGVSVPRNNMPDDDLGTKTSTTARPLLRELP